MGALGIINSDTEIRNSIETAFKQNPGYDNDSIFLTQEEEIYEFLNYALPELLVINFSDPSINIDKIVDHIQSDKYILNFGIIGIFDPAVEKEEDLFKKYKAINVLSMLDNYMIRSHLSKSIEIIEQNYQIIFHREFSKRLFEGASGKFILDNDLLTVPLYAGICATILSQRGLIDPDKKMHLQLALMELIVNGIEHGNCGISYEEKTRTLEAGTTAVDMIAEKCKDPVIRDKKLILEWDIKTDLSTFTILDQGKGFDVNAHLQKIKKQDEYSLHGRGIKMAASLSHKLRYNSKGNQVTLIIKNKTTVDLEIPAGFSNEQIIRVKEGDVVIKEGDPSDFLYYISSGTYEVLHNGKPVGTLSAQDIFMGEMSFLLNRRRSATIKATSDGKLIYLTQKTFINIIRENPHYGIFLSKLLAKRLLRSNVQVAAQQ